MAGISVKNMPTENIVITESKQTFTSKVRPGQSMLLLYSVESEMPCLHVLQRTNKRH